MSADNWTACPRCMKVVSDNATQAAEKLLADYGKVSAEEYDRRRIAQATAPRKPVDTLREDWEIGMQPGGTFTVSYGCSCEVCGFSFEYAASRFVGGGRTTMTTKLSICAETLRAYNACKPLLDEWVLRYGERHVPTATPEDVVAIGDAGFWTVLSWPFSASQGDAYRVCLAGVDLQGHNLASADFYGGDLAGANLARAILEHACLANSYCAGVKLFSANLRYANMHHADLAAANLHAADLYGANLHAADLTGANLHAADLRSASLRKANLQGADLTGANLQDADLNLANLQGADLTGANLHNADISGANLAGAILSDVDMTTVYNFPEGAQWWEKTKDRK